MVTVVRLILTEVVNCQKEQFDVYIGRGSKWGNRFSHLPLKLTKAEVQVKTREEAIECYAEWIKHQPELLASLANLKGKRLGCYCKPLACHGDVLVKLLEG